VAFLRAADTGIVDLRVERHEEPSPPGSSIRGNYFRTVVSFRHKGADDEGRSWLPLEAESSGTNRMLEIATRIVPVLRHGGLLCVDELEASLHPMLALEVLRTFHDPNRNPRRAQLLFTTHDTNLLGNVAAEPLLGRDQVWFTEKDDEGATHLYPLTDFHSRGAENIERGYLQGRYGAVPFLGKLVESSSELAGTRNATPIA
jgi:AAA15 family ATPase/GTPase